MNMFDEASALRDVLEMRSITQAQLACMMGVSQSFVANKLRLLKLSDAVRKKILDHGLSERHARLILKINDDELALLAADKMAKMHLSVSASEVIVDSIITKDKERQLAYIEYGEQIREFERLVERGLASLAACGIKSRQSVYFSKNKKYITIVIDE